MDAHLAPASDAAVNIIKIAPCDGGWRQAPNSPAGPSLRLTGRIGTQVLTLRIVKTWAIRARNSAVLAAHDDKQHAEKMTRRAALGSQRHANLHSPGGRARHPSCRLLGLGARRHGAACVGGFAWRPGRGDGARGSAAAYPLAEKPDLAGLSRRESQPQKRVATGRDLGRPKVGDGPPAQPVRLDAGCSFSQIR